VKAVREEKVKLREVKEVMDEQSGVSKEEEVMGEGTDESGMEISPNLQCLSAEGNTKH